MASIFANNREDQFCFYLTYHGLTPIELEAITTYARVNKSLTTFFDATQFRLDRLKDSLREHWTLAVYYKIYFPQLIGKRADRILYMDTDTIVLNKLDELFRMDMNGLPVAAVYDCYVKKQPHIGLVDEGSYFNSGVMLIDVQKWNELRISEKALDYAYSNIENLDFVDQDALNAVLINKWKKIEDRFNLIYSYIPQPANRKVYRKLRESVVIVHFTLEKPWEPLCKNRFRKDYKYYFRKSPLSNSRIRRRLDFKCLCIQARIRLTEIYLDSLWLQIIWRKLRQ
tara:strand:- start:14749 stop:15600 length:852 start_codon:yes stop_codon:yes gene_type:complete